jgi:hypothetical protein
VPRKGFEEQGLTLLRILDESSDWPGQRRSQPREDREGFPSGTVHSHGRLADVPKSMSASRQDGAHNLADSRYGARGSLFARHVPLFPAEAQLPSRGNEICSSHPSLFEAELRNNVQTPIRRTEQPAEETLLLNELIAPTFNALTFSACTRPLRSNICQNLRN